jgi:hypothetical protein
VSVDENRNADAEVHNYLESLAISGRKRLVQRYRLEQPWSTRKPAAPSRLPAMHHIGSRQGSQLLVYGTLQALVCQALGHGQPQAGEGFLLWALLG